MNNLNFPANKSTDQFLDADSQRKIDTRSAEYLFFGKIMSSAPHCLFLRDDSIARESNKSFNVTPLNSPMVQQQVTDMELPIQDPVNASKVLRAHRSVLPYQVTKENAIGFSLMKKIFPDFELNDGILWCDEAHSKIYRQLLLNYITPQAVEGWRQGVRYLAKAEIETAGNSLELSDFMSRFSCKAVCQHLLGYSGEVDMLSNAIQVLLKPSTIWCYKIKLEVALKEQVDTIFNEAEGGLVNLMREKQFSSSQIKAMIILLAIAGQHTTSVVLKYAAQKSAVKDVMYRDLFRQASEDQPDKASELLNRFILESLRVSEPVDNVLRHYADPEQQEVDVLHVGIAAMSRCPHIIGESPDPRIFDPARTLYDSIPSFLPNLPWFPFGAQRGAHTCVGWRFFFMEAQEFMKEFWLTKDASLTGSWLTSDLKLCLSQRKVD